MQRNPLDEITKPEDITHLSLKELRLLAEQIRQRIIDVVSEKGGHLGSNLGTVELCIALHRIFNSPIDKLIFDTSHQTYPHKFLTGRAKNFDTLCSLGGLCGFCDPSESPHDIFAAGHNGTGLSLALGTAKARDISKGDETIVSIIGDASLTCGLTLEALNNIPKDLKKFIVILNDNKMSISNNVGRITHVLSRLVNNPRSNKFFHVLENLLHKLPAGETLAKGGHRITESLKNLVSPAVFFENFGLDYVGPIDGHNIEKLLDTFKAVKKNPQPTIIHILTTKGKGLDIATQHPIKYHGVKPFDKETGEFVSSPSPKPTFPKIFGRYLLELADEDPNLVAITPAMPLGSCLTPFMKKYPERCIDVGIAEGHAVTYAGGIAKDPTKKVIAVIYATFLQRAFDNVFHDVCLQRLPVIFAIDRAGLGNGYGTTHHGIYDIAFLNAMPNMIICQPRNGHILKQLLLAALSWNQPTAIRYPNDPTTEETTPVTPHPLGKGEIINLGQDIAIIALGNLSSLAHSVRDILGLNVTIVDPIFIKPLDEELLHNLLLTHKLFITIEEHTIHGGLASIFNSFLLQNNYTNTPTLNFGVPNTFLPHGSNKDLCKEIGLDPQSIADTIEKKWQELAEEHHDHCTIS